MADTVSISPDMSDSVSVLLVDADVEFAAEAAGYVERRYDRITVETATTAAKGVTQLEQGTFDCVVADCVTGTNDAFDFLEAVRDRDPDRPFIVVAEQDPETVAAESISAGDRLPPEAFGHRTVRPPREPRIERRRTVPRETCRAATG